MFSFKLDTKENAKLRIIWLHGWGATSENILPLAMLFRNQVENITLDLPGFGKSPVPNRVYSNDDYADVVANFIKDLPYKKTILAGHSNGGRIAVHVSAKYPELIDGVVLIAGAGIPQKHSILFKFYSWSVTTFSPIIKKIFPFLRNVSLSSSDYKNTSGVMRQIFINALGTDSTTTAQKIKVPTLLIYGGRDSATPPYMGEAYKKAIPVSELQIIEESDHWGLLLDYKNKVHHYVTKFIREKL